MNLNHDEILALWEHLKHEYVENDTPLHALLSRIEEYLDEQSRLNCSKTHIS